MVLFYMIIVILCCVDLSVIGIKDLGYFYFLFDSINIEERCLIGYL